MATADSETPPLNHSPPDAAPQKRRRRRAPATGATDDCFACRKRQTQCDRKRPYCSQCLKIGKECSGYKTTLTWGVGVASRGKLRGMSVPIANPPPNAASQMMDSKPRGSSMSTLCKPFRESLLKEDFSPQRQRAPSSSPSSRDGLYGHAGLESIPEKGFPFFTLPTSNPDWAVCQEVPRSVPRNFNFGGLDPLQTSFEPNNGEGLLSSSTGSLLSTASLGGISDGSVEHYHNSPNTPEDVAFRDPFQVSHNDLSISNESLPFLPFGQLKQHDDFTFDPVIQSPLEYDTSVPFFGLQSNPRTVPELQHLASGHPLESTTPIRKNLQPLSESDTDPQDAPSFSNTSYTQRANQPAISPPSINPLPVIPRMQYLIDYYDKEIAPFLVAFEGPENPYRRFILPLAMKNAGLQNALAALSANNIRMRQVPDTLLSDLSSENPLEDTFGKVTAKIGRPTQEEQHYKAMSIEYLNSQLGNPSQAKDDAVLATLLILCLFHVCDSGFSRFKTQLTGVQKLLKLRGDKHGSEFVSWVEMFFAWFDVMTSCVNDREPEIHSSSIDLTDPSNNLGSLEEFSGCDGGLFKLIARLGRLNLLSQGRRVRARPRIISPTHSSSLLSPKYRAVKRDYYSMESDSDADSNAGDSSTSESRPSFWEEWSDLRLRLQEWQPTRPQQVAQAQQDNKTLPAAEHALMHMSEAFRYSALVYTERLAYPNVPAGITNIQELVSQALWHMEQIGANSCMTKFLLWPLFVTGTECVDKGQREFIRTLCVTIQKESGFYNNLSGLEVLERVWRDYDRESCNGDVNVASSWAEQYQQQQPFHWRKAMDRSVGEYIII